MQTIRNYLSRFALGKLLGLLLLILLYLSIDVIAQQRNYLATEVRNARRRVDIEEEKKPIPDTVLVRSGNAKKNNAEVKRKPKAIMPPRQEAENEMVKK